MRQNSFSPSDLFSDVIRIHRSGGSHYKPILDHNFSCQTCTRSYKDNFGLNLLYAKILALLLVQKSHVTTILPSDWFKFLEQRYATPKQFYKIGSWSFFLSFLETHQRERSDGPSFCPNFFHFIFFRNVSAAVNDINSRFYSDRRGPCYKTLLGKQQAFSSRWQHYSQMKGL